MSACCAVLPSFRSFATSPGKSSIFPPALFTRAIHWSSIYYTFTVSTKARLVAVAHCPSSALSALHFLSFGFSRGSSASFHFSFRHFVRLRNTTELPSQPSLPPSADPPSHKKGLERILPLASLLVCIQLISNFFRTSTPHILFE